LPLPNVTLALFLRCYSMATTADAAHRTLEDEDESVRIAVRALGDMRSGRRASSKRSPCVLRQAPSHAPPASSSSAYTPALSVASTASTSALTTPTPSVHDDAQADYISRVSGLPIVNSALRVSMAAYEQGKASSRVVKVCTGHPVCCIRTRADACLCSTARRWSNRPSPQYPALSSAG
jgi:hypothetical protein